MSKFNLRFLILFLITFLTFINFVHATENEKKDYENIKKGIIATSTGIGGWFGSGVGYAATKKIAEWLYKTEEETGYINWATAQAQINDFIKNYAIVGKTIGATIGAGASGYLAHKVCNNYLSYVESWNKILRLDFNNVDRSDLEVYAGNFLGFCVIGYSVYDLSK